MCNGYSSHYFEDFGLRFGRVFHSRFSSRRATHHTKNDFQARVAGHFGVCLSGTGGCAGPSRCGIISLDSCHGRNDDILKHCDTVHVENAVSLPRSHRDWICFGTSPLSDGLRQHFSGRISWSTYLQLCFITAFGKDPLRAYMNRELPGQKVHLEHSSNLARRAIRIHLHPSSYFLTPGRPLNPSIPIFCSA